MLCNSWPKTIVDFRSSGKYKIETPAPQNLSVLKFGDGADTVSEKKIEIKVIARDESCYCKLTFSLKKRLFQKKTLFSNKTLLKVFEVEESESIDRLSKFLSSISPVAKEMSLQFTQVL